MRVFLGKGAGSEDIGGSSRLLGRVGEVKSMAGERRDSVGERAGDAALFICGERLDMACVHTSSCVGFGFLYARVGLEKLEQA
jgi:hypothetical protein